jgi:hypothetical protein
MAWASGVSSQPAWPTQSVMVERARSMSSRPKIWHSRYSGVWSANLLTRMCVSSPAPARHRSTGRLGASAWLIVWQPAQASLGRTWRTTWKVPGS